MNISWEDQNETSAITVESQGHKFVISESCEGILIETQKSIVVRPCSNNKIIVEEKE